MFKNFIGFILISITVISCGSSYSTLKKEKPNWAEIFIDNEIIFLDPLDTEYESYDKDDLFYKVVTGKLEMGKNYETFKIKFYDKKTRKNWDSYGKWVYENGKLVLIENESNKKLIIENLEKSSNGPYYNIVLEVDESITDNSFPFFIGINNKSKTISYPVRAGYSNHFEYLNFVIYNHKKESKKKQVENNQKIKIKNEQSYKELAQNYKISGGGWQNLKWGIAVEEAYEVLKNEGYKKPEAHEQDFAEHLKNIQEQQQKELNPNKITFNEKELVMKKDNLQVTCYFAELMPGYFALYQVGVSIGIKFPKNIENNFPLFSIN